MSLDVFVETEQVSDAVAIPREAVIVEAGQPIAFVLKGGETFVRRFLTLGIEDGDRVEVKDGIAIGDRVVATGAYTLRLASLAPDTVSSHHHHH